MSPKDRIASNGPPPRNNESAPLKGRAEIIIERLDKVYPDAHTALRWSNPLELMVAVVLSAQCTDKRVNHVTSDFFKKYKSVTDYAGADPHNLEQDIRPTGFFRNKAKNIIGAAQMMAGE